MSEATSILDLPTDPVSGGSVGGNITINAQETIQQEMQQRIGNNRNQAKRFSPITFDEAMSFKEDFEFPAYTTVYVWATGTATLKYEAEKTNPNTRVLGTDENYLITSGLEIEEGRNFTQNEVFYGSNVVIIGSQLVNNLFIYLTNLFKILLNTNFYI